MPTKKIRLRRALILGNFYNQQVKIIQRTHAGLQSYVDTIIGIRPSGILTKSGRSISIQTIKEIHQIL